MVKTSEEYKTTCCYCGVGCGVVVTKHANGQLSLRGDESHPSNKGMLCSKGMNLHYTAMDTSDRLLHPQMRYNRSMPLQQVSWDAALERTAAVFKTFVQKYGPDSVGFYVSGQCSTEEYYVINKLIKGFIGSNNIDTNSRLCMSSAVVGYKLTLGEDTVPVCYDDIELADCFLVTGANPAWAHPIIWRRVEAHKAANPNVKIICIDPRRTQTAQQADLHLQIHPGTDVTLTNAIGRVLIESGAIDGEFIAHHTDGFEAYQAQVFKRSIAEAASICGVAAQDIVRAAQLIAQSKGFLSMWTMGLNQSVIGVNKNLSLIDLHLITGSIGKPGNGPFSLTGQPNAMGGREVGGLANMLPAHRDLANPAHREAVERFWGTPLKIAPKPGYTATEMFEALADGRMKAIWVVCTNPLVSLPDANQVEEALKKAKFVVVQEMSNRSDTLAYADVVLPAAGWLEKETVFTNSERRITYMPKVIDAPGEALPDAEIITSFAQKMGFGEAFNYQTSSQIYAEHCASTKGTNLDISGLSYEVLKQQRSVQWGEETSNASLGGRGLFYDHQFYTPNRRAQLHPVPDENHSEPLNEDFPLVLTTGRIRDQWHTMTKTGKVNKLNQHLPQPYLELHPSDAAQRGLKDGQVAVIEGRRGTVQVKVKISDEVKQGVCFLPMHFGKIAGSTFGRANNLTNNLIDPRSKEPDFKFTAVQVRAYVKPPEKIVIIGAGSAGLGFINSYRSLNRSDEIHVFSKEMYPFYNRVMLPDYLSGQQTWEQLVKLREEEFAKANIVVHKGVEIKHIDRKNKVLTDANGEEYHYDKLILGMGSRAFMPPNVPKIPGIFNMRSRLDADSLLPFLSPNLRDAMPHNPTSEIGVSQESSPRFPNRGANGLASPTQPSASAVIVGGGLLGLELAASLREMGVQVTVVQRISRFMDRQLDPLGSELLHQEIVARGIEVFYNEEVSTFYGTDRLEAVRLKSGRKIPCNVAVFAIGTVPVVELARECELEVNRGVVVNDYLQTSDPDIFAMGEIAQWRGEMWGITAAAEQQAEVAAKFLAGDLASYYKGSLSMNILKMEGLHLCSLGMIETPNDPAYEEVVFIDKAKHYYKKCIIHQDRLVGAILIGDKSEFLEFKDLIANGIELSEKRLELLRSGKKADPVVGKLVCSCNNVGQGNLEKAIESGCTDFAKLCQLTGAGTGCGSCRPEVRQVLEKSKKTEFQES